MPVPPEREAPKTVILDATGRGRYDPAVMGDKPKKEEKADQADQADKADQAEKSDVAPKGDFFTRFVFKSVMFGVSLAVIGPLLLALGFLLGIVKWLTGGDMTFGAGILEGLSAAGILLMVAIPIIVVAILIQEWFSAKIEPDSRAFRFRRDGH